jgi:hypothetical protein
MTRRTIVILALHLAGLGLLGGNRVLAEDKPKAGLTGTWTKKAGELKIEFVDKEVMKLHPHGDNPVIVIVCGYQVEKDGIVKASITEIQGKEEVREKAKSIVPVGLKFSFTWKVSGDAATLEDTKGDKTDTLKSHLEGEFELKK